MCIDAMDQINALDRVHWYVQSVANTMSGSVMFWCSSTDLIPIMSWCMQMLVLYMKGR